MMKKLFTVTSVASLLMLGGLLFVPLGAFAADDAYDAAWGERNGYIRTSETCNFSDNTVCSSSRTCIPDVAGSDAGHCYDKGASGSGGGLVNLLNVSTLEEALALVLRVLVQIGSMILVLALVWTGFKFVAAQGNEEEIRNARSALTWTVIGGLLLLGAEALSLVIQATIQSL